MRKQILLASFILCAFSVFFTSVARASETETPVSSGLVMLLNRDHSVEKNFAPEKLQNLAKVVRSSKAEMLLRPEAAEAYIAMCKAMTEDGVPAPTAVSGYRTFDYQTGLFNKKIDGYKAQGMTYADAYKKASTSVAIPGTSEHQTGLAIDISADGSLNSNFASTKAGKWLEENSWKYGFILRYQEDKSGITGIIFEPWHFRYVGVPHAVIMYENGWCLEEYITELSAGDAPMSVEYGGSVYTVYYLPGDYAQMPVLAENETQIDFSADNAGGFILTTEHQPVELSYAPIIIPEGN